MSYPHTKLKAYQKALSFHGHVIAIRKSLPRGLGDLADQLHRASTSVVLNLAEGASCRTPGTKRRHFDIALASAGECAAALDLVALEVEAATVPAAREDLEAIGALTTGLLRRL